jgi:putative transposase
VLLPNLHLDALRVPRVASAQFRGVMGGGHLPRGLLDRTPVWNQAHLLHALREFKAFCNGRCPSPGSGRLLHDVA